MSKFLVALKNLEEWFERQKRILPWRNEPSFYRVWISEIMLQQTQVVTVVPFFERFMNRFPSVEGLAMAPEEDVLLMWAGLGYYSRARNLHKGAKKIFQQGTFPQTRSGWLEIPGVGEYTAGAILSIAGNQPEAILDGNVERVLSRWRRVARQRGDSAYKERLWRISRIVVEKGHQARIQPSLLNQALMELGATVCTPQNPQCTICPVTSICKARQKGEEKLYPPRKKPKEWIQVKEKMICLVDDQGRVLLRKREKGEWRAGLWDLLHEIPPESRRQVELVKEMETRHIVTRHKIHRVTEVWRTQNQKEWSASETPLWTNTHRWVSLQNPEVPVGAALKKVLSKIHTD